MADLNAYIASGDRAVNYVALLSGEDFDEDGLLTMVRAHSPRYPTSDSSALEDLSAEWELEMLDLGSAINSEDADRFADIEVTYQTVDSLDLELAKSTGGDFPLVSMAFTVMVTFVSISYGSRSRIHTHSLLATAGVGIVGMAIMTGFGVALAMRQPFISIVGFLPFLAISIGVDDIFILMDNLVAIDPASMGPEDRLALTFRRAGSSILTTTVTDCLAFLVGTSSVFPAIRIFCVYALLVLGIDFVYQITIFGVLMRYYAIREHENRPEFCLSSRQYDDPADAYACGGAPAVADPDAKKPMVKRAMRAYATMLSKGPVKALVLLAFSAWLAVSILYAYEIEEGLDLRDIVPKNSYMRDLLDAQDKYYRVKGIPFVVVIADVDVRDTDTQDGILTLRDALQGDEWVNSGPETFVSWMELFFQWYALQPGADASGRPAAGEFYDQLDLFLEEPVFGFLKTEIVRESDAPGAAVVASRVSAFFESSENTSDDARALRSVRKVLDQVKRDEDLPELFAYMEAFIYWEQLYETTPSVIQNLILAGVAVTFVTLLLLGHPMASFWVLTMVVLVDFYLFGWMGLLGIPLDTVSLVSLTMAVGFSVDYSSHVAHAFMEAGADADGTNNRNQRMIHSMEEIGGSVLKGATSTMLGTIVLAGSSSAIFQNFFKHMCGVVIFGGLSGLCLLPVILSLVGPLRARSSGVSPKMSTELKQLP